LGDLLFFVFLWVEGGGGGGGGGGSKLRNSSRSGL